MQMDVGSRACAPWTGHYQRISQLDRRSQGRILVDWVDRADLDHGFYSIVIIASSDRDQ